MSSLNNIDRVIFQSLYSINTLKETQPAQRFLIKGLANQFIDFLIEHELDEEFQKVNINQRYYLLTKNYALHLPFRTFKDQYFITTISKKESFTRQFFKSDFFQEISYAFLRIRGNIGVQIIRQNGKEKEILYSTREDDLPNPNTFLE